MQKSTLLAAALVLVSCTQSTDTAKAKAEFDQICTSHRDYLETRKLKGVDEAELLVERDRRMKEGLTLPIAQKAGEAAGLPRKADARKAVESLANEAGLKDWACAELDQN